MINPDTQLALDDIELSIGTINSKINDLEKPVSLQDHSHMGSDVSRVTFENIAYRKHWISHTIYGTDAATAANYGVIFINQMGACHVSKFYEVHQTAGNDGGAVTLMLEKLTGTEAPGSGDDILSAALSLKATANTVQTGILTNTIANRNIGLGDRLCLEDTGALTSVANVTVFIELTFTV